MGSGLFFQSEGCALYGFHHPARGVDGAARGAVVFVHGCFEERQDAVRPTWATAERLAAAGHHALRFDLYGHGESEGEFEQATLAQWVQDAVAAVRVARERARCDTVALVGVRLGACVAARAARALAGTGEAPARLVLWQPVVRGRAYVLEVLRAHLASEMVLRRGAAASREAMVARLEAGEPVNLFGYRLSPVLYSELLELELGDDLRAARTPALLLDLVRAQGAAGDAELAALAASLGAAATLEHVVEPQPPYAEGKHFAARADGAAAATERYLGAR